MATAVSAVALKAARDARKKARRRDRGGIFQPLEKNAMLELLMARRKSGRLPVPATPPEDEDEDEEEEKKDDVQSDELSDSGVWDDEDLLRNRRQRELADEYSSPVKVFQTRRCATEQDSRPSTSAPTTSDPIAFEPITSELSTFEPFMPEPFTSDAFTSEPFSCEAITSDSVTSGWPTSEPNWEPPVREPSPPVVIQKHQHPPAITQPRFPRDIPTIDFASQNIRKIKPQKPIPSSSKTKVHTSSERDGLTKRIRQPSPILEDVRSNTDDRSLVKNASLKRKRQPSPIPEDMSHSDIEVDTILAAVEDDDPGPTPMKRQRVASRVYSPTSTVFDDRLPSADEDDHVAPNKKVSKLSPINNKHQHKTNNKKRKSSSSSDSTPPLPKKRRRSPERWQNEPEYAPNYDDDDSLRDEPSLLVPTKEDSPRPRQKRRQAHTSHDPEESPKPPVKRVFRKKVIPIIVVQPLGPERKPRVRLTPGKKSGRKRGRPPKSRHRDSDDEDKENVGPSEPKRKRKLGKIPEAVWELATKGNRRHTIFVQPAADLSKDELNILV